MKAGSRLLCTLIFAVLLPVLLLGCQTSYYSRSGPAQMQLPWVIGTVVLFFIIIVIIVLSFVLINKKSKTIEAQLKIASTYEMASQAKSSFLAKMSHEIRTPMNAILGITEILMHNDSLPSETTEGLNKIYNSCDLLLCIINDILDFSKIEAGKMDIIPARYKLANLINDSIHLNMMRFDNKPIKFELQIDENLPSTLIGDEQRIKQILNNLLSNAFKYTDYGQVTLSVYCEPCTDGVMLVICVRDTGFGMTQEQVDKLFNEYSRFHQESGRTIQGTGLGMAIARQLVRLMDGEIRVESVPGKGSLFTLRLPQKKVDDEVLGKDLVDKLKNFRLRHLKNTGSQVAREPMPYGRVLIVDDVESNLYVANGLMKLYHLQAESVMSGFEAIEKVQSGKVYDIIFMDHMMPEMDGMETTKRLRGMGYTQPIVALTANAVAGQAEIFMQNGFNDFISKPINIRQLNAVLNKMIRDKQPPEVIEAARQQMTLEAGSEVEHSNLDKLLLESFIRDVYKALSIFDDLLQSGNLETEKGLQKFTITIHGIKSSLANIGELKMSETAYQLEKSGKDGKTDYIKEDLAGFMQNLRSLLEKLEAEKEVCEENQNENKEEIRNIFLAIQEACADYNRRGVLDLLTDVKNCSGETRKVLDSIKEHITHSEFEEAEIAAATYAVAIFSDEKSDGKGKNDELF